MKSWWANCFLNSKPIICYKPEFSLIRKLKMYGTLLFHSFHTVNFIQIF